MLSHIKNGHIPLDMTNLAYPKYSTSLDSRVIGYCVSAEHDLIHLETLGAG